MEIKNRFAVEIVNHLLEVSIFLYLLLLLTDKVWKDSVSNYFNLNYVLASIAIIAIVVVFTKQKAQSKSITNRDYAYMIILSLFSSAIILATTYQLGWLSYVISITSGLIILLLIYMVIRV